MSATTRARTTTAIQLKTELPGPRSRALMERRAAAVPRGPVQATPLFIEEAEGAVIVDVDGNRLLDFAGGIGCLNVGHARPEVVRAIQEQAAASPTAASTSRPTRATCGWPSA